MAQRKMTWILAVLVWSVPSTGHTQYQVSENITSKCKLPFIMTVHVNDHNAWVPIIVRDVDDARGLFDVDCDSDGRYDFRDSDASVMCMYKSPGDYVITICGEVPSLILVDDFEHFMDAPGTQPLKYYFSEIYYWGDVHWRSMAHFAEYAHYIRIYASDAPILTSVKSMNYMFAGTRLMNEPIEHWDVSNVKSMDGMFMNAKSFNQPLERWNTSSVISMYGMFKYAEQFNQPLAAWDVSNVQIFNEMFAGTGQFNQPLNDWDVSGALLMMGMFENSASFDQPLDRWNPVSVRSGLRMFYGARAFKQDISDWQMTKLKNAATKEPE